MMVWTRTNARLVVVPAEAGRPLLIDRRENTIIAALSKDEALGLIHDLSSAFGTDGVPSTAAYTEVTLRIENPDGFYPAHNPDDPDPDPGSGRGRGRGPRVRRGAAL